MTTGASTTAAKPSTEPDGEQAQTAPTGARPSTAPAGTAGVAHQSRLASGRGEEVAIQRDAAAVARQEVAATGPEVADMLDSDPAQRRRTSIAREIGTLADAILVKGRRRGVLLIAAGLFAVIVANAFGQVRLNEWNGAFFDAVGRRDLPAFYQQLQVFFVIVAVLLSIVVVQTWLNEMLKVRVRERLAKRLFDRWLEPNRVYQLGFVGEAGSAPDQRMQEDTRLVAELSTELGVGLLNALILLISFIGVLWGLSSQVSFVMFGREVAIPGYMVWIAFAYAGIGSGLTWLVGRPLIDMNTRRYAREAEFRFALVRVNESAESIALYGGEKDERRVLEETLSGVLAAMRKLSWGLSRLTWITHGYGWVSIVVPVIAAAPGYFRGDLSLGGLMMVVGAFTQVQNALKYFVDQFWRIADWRSAVGRLATFTEAVKDLEVIGEEHAKIELLPHPEGRLSFEGVSIALADGSEVIEEATAEIQPGERVLITGESGSGKSTLFRAIGGLWPWGAGTICTPPRERMMFMPQRPYIPLGPLRAALCYPHPPTAFSDEELRAVLERCGLEEFTGDLDDDRRWDKALSGGQQQRLAFARLLLHRPDWVFLDEATAALDEENQARVMSIFDEELAGATVLSIGHRPGLEEFHQRKLSLVKTDEGGAVFSRRPGAEQIPPPWRRRLAKWIAGG